MGNVSTSSQEFPAAAPNWKPDASALECEICEYGFSVVRRRHHCRACGSVICSNCFTKSNNITCDLNIYGYMEQQFVCEQCLQLLNDNFSNNLKEVKKFSKYIYNEIQFMNPFIYNHIWRGFSGNIDSHQFIQFSAYKHFTILIPYKFEEQKDAENNTYDTIDLNTIQNEFDFYRLWKTKKISTVQFGNKLIHPHTIELLYNIAKQHKYITKDFIFLPENIYCYGLQHDLYIIPKIISFHLKEKTKQWIEEYRNRNIKMSPITRHDIIATINNKESSYYKIQQSMLRKFERLKGVNNAINMMQNAQYDEIIGEYYELHSKFNNAYAAFMTYKNRYNENENEEKDGVTVDVYIKLMSTKSQMCEIDLILNRNKKCGFCREIFDSTFIGYTISYCHHKYCVTCCNAILLLWIRFDLYPICIVNGCFAKCNQHKFSDMN
eukprot:330406_1